MTDHGHTILRIKFGSHLYGTATPTSDLDFKSIFVPTARDILLGRVKGSISTKRPKAEGEKNYAGEVDEEAYSLQRFLGLVAEGQTVAMDVLFAPDWAHVEPAALEWQEIVANRDRLLTRKSSAFIGYARTQANKYGIKGSRVAAARAVLAALNVGYEEHGSIAKLSLMGEGLEKLFHGVEFVSFIDVPTPSGIDVRHLEVCGRKLPYTASIKNCRDVVQRLVDEYGPRALQAECQQGVDWKALSHAVRVATQAVELLTTGHVTFPSPNADHIMAIKLGHRSYQDVAAEVEQCLVDVETAAAISTLPEDVDRVWIDDFVVRTYGREIAS
jgi:hypothetical protein